MESKLRLVLEGEGLYINEDVTYKNNLLDYINNIVNEYFNEKTKIKLVILLKNQNIQISLSNTSSSVAESSQTNSSAGFITFETNGESSQTNNSLDG